MNMDVCDFLYFEKFFDFIIIFYGFIIYKLFVSGYFFYD